MRRRDFLGTVVGAAVMQSGAFGSVFSGREADVSATFDAPIGASSFATTKQKGVAPMAIGVMIAPAIDHPEIAIARVRELGMSNCFLSLDGYIGKFSSSAADQLSAALEKHGVTRYQRGSGWAGTTGVGFLGGTGNDWTGAAGHASGSDGRAEADFRLRQAAGDTSGANTLRFHSRKSERSALPTGGTGDS